MAYKLLIDGEMVDGAEEMPIVNPATGAAFAMAPRADAAQLETGIAAAKRASPGWGRIPLADRRKALSRFCDAIEEREEALARLLTLEQGKPAPQAAWEVRAAILTLRYTLELDLPLKTLHEDENGRIIAQRTPLGVIAAIVPWNFPVLLLMVKIAPAMLAGNCVIAKPAPTTPLTTLAIGECAAGILPAGVLSTIVDAGDLGAVLSAHPDIAKISFTGSTATGRKVMESAATGPKRITLELGGNDAAIVLADIDLDEVAPQIFNSAFLNAGQVCLATKRIYAHRSIYDGLCDRLAQYAREAVVDDGSKQGTTIGPVQNLDQFEKLKTLIEESREVGTVIAGGVLDRDGYFIAPTIVRDISHDARLVREEQFGPIVPVLPFDDEDEAVRMANDSEFGLGGSIWTRDPKRGLALALQVETGTLWINKHMDLPPDIPIGGAKHSGQGVQHGQEGLEEFTQLKIIHVPSSAIEALDIAEVQQV